MTDIRNEASKVRYLFEVMAPYSWHGSFAVWGSWQAAEQYKKEDNIRIPEDGRDEHLNLLHGRYVIIGLNPAGNGKLPTHTQGHEWTNFHSSKPKHNDHFLANAFRGTNMWGCYMTDLITDIAQSNSSKVFAADHNVAAFIEEISLLGSNNPLLICLGKKVFDALNKSPHAAHLKKVRIPHYSRSNANIHKADPERYRSLVHDKLAEWI